MQPHNSKLKLPSLREQLPDHFPDLTSGRPSAWPAYSACPSVWSRGNSSNTASYAASPASTTSSLRLLSLQPPQSALPVAEGNKALVVQRTALRSFEPSLDSAASSRARRASPRVERAGRAKHACRKPTSATERKRRAWESDILIKFENLLRIDGHQFHKPLSAHNKKSSGLEFTKREILEQIVWKLEWFDDRKRALLRRQAELARVRYQMEMAPKLIHESDVAGMDYQRLRDLAVKMQRLLPPYSLTVLDKLGGEPSKEDEYEEYAIPIITSAGETSSRHLRCKLSRDEKRIKSFSKKLSECSVEEARQIVTYLSRELEEQMKSWPAEGDRLHRYVKKPPISAWAKRILAEMVLRAKL